MPPVGFLVPVLLPAKLVRGARAGCLEAGGGGLGFALGGGGFLLGGGGLGFLLGGGWLCFSGGGGLLDVTASAFRPTGGRTRAVGSPPHK